MHQTKNVRDPSAAFPLTNIVNEASDRRQANRAVGWGGAGLAVTGVIELVIALISGSVALLGDALHNLSDVSTSLLVFIGFRASRKSATESITPTATNGPRISLASASPSSSGPAPRLLRRESVNKLVHHGGTHYAAWGIAGAAVGIARQSARRPVQYDHRPPDQFGHPDRGRETLLAGCPVLGGRPCRVAWCPRGPALGRRRRRPRSSPDSSATSGGKSASTSRTG